MSFDKCMQLCNDHNQNVESITSGCENHQGLWLSETEGTGDLDTAGLKT